MRVVCGLLCLLAAMWSVEIEAVTIEITVGSGPGEPNVEVIRLDENSGTFVEKADGTKSWSGTWHDNERSVLWAYRITTAPPGVVAVGGWLSLENQTASTQTFSVSVGVVASEEIPSGSQMVGYSSISVSDANFDGVAQISTPSSSEAIYTGTISGVVQRSLFPGSLPGSFSLDVSTLAGIGSASDSFTSESTTTTLSPGMFLGLNHIFQLTAGDVATINSTFAIGSVPVDLQSFVVE